MMTEQAQPYFSTQWEREDYERQKRGEKPLGPPMTNNQDDWMSVALKREVQIKDLEAALEPFASVADDYERADRLRAKRYKEERGDDYNYPPHADSHRVSVFLGACRRARKALGD